MPEIVGRLRPPRLASAPASPAVGELYADTVANAPYYWNGTAWVAWRAPAVSSLPSSPVDGQECYFVADATNGVVWHLKYRAADPSAYKWQFVGGGYLHTQTAATDTTGSNLLIAIANPLSITLPLAGDYDLEWGFNGYNASSAANLQMGLSIAGATPATTELIAGSTPGVNQALSFMRAARKTGLSASVAVAAWYSSGTGTSSFRDRWMRIKPVRVG